MNTIQDQAQVCLQLISAPDTRQIYSGFAGRTWLMLKSLTRLLWLTLCGIYIVAAWAVEQANQAIRSYRDLYEQHQDGNLGLAIASATGQFIKEVAIAIHGYAKQRLATEVSIAAAPAAAPLAAPAAASMAAAPMAAPAVPMAAPAVTPLVSAPQVVGN